MSAAVTSTRPSPVVSWLLATSAFSKVPSISARSASVQLQGLPSLRWVRVIWFARFFFARTLILKHTERCNHKRTRSKSSFCCFFSFMSQLNLFGRCFIPFCLFRFPTHARVSPTTICYIIHFSLIRHPSFGAPDCCWAWESDTKVVIPSSIAARPHT